MMVHTHLRMTTMKMICLKTDLALHTILTENLGVYKFVEVWIWSFLDHIIVLVSNALLLFTRPKLKEHMDYCVNHPEEMSKLSKLKAQISEVKGIMMDNIEKVRIYLLVEWYKKWKQLMCSVRRDISSF